jgi:hypothetical protein
MIHMKTIAANLPRLALLIAFAVAPMSRANAQTDQTLKDPKLIGSYAPINGSCTPIGVAVFENRVHVRCSAPIAGFTFFAVSTADAQNAARFLNLFTTARVNNRVLTIFFDTADLSGASFGCLNSDCRVARGAEMF